MPPPLRRIAWLAVPLLLLVSTPPVRAEVLLSTRPDLPHLRAIGLSRGWSTETADSTDRLERDLLRAGRLGADTVALQLRGLVASAHSPFIEDPLLDDPFERGRLARLVRQAHGLGLNVVLQPRLVVQSGEWSGNLRMRRDRDWQKWFEEYRRWIVAWGAWAQEHEVDLLGVGECLGRSVEHEEAWREVIAAVRRVWSGPVYYAADAETELSRVPFFDAVDLIAVSLEPDLRGIEARGPRSGPWSAADADSLLVHELGRALDPIAEELARQVRLHDRPAFLARVQIPPVEEGWSAAGRRRGDAGAEGRRDQRRAYRAVFERFGKRPWMRGIVWWRTHPESRLVDGREAAAELRAQWSSPPVGWAARRVRGQGGVVVSGDSLATRVGRSVLRRGGNAADAAVATAMALAVTHPQAGNLGGGGFLLFHDPGRGRSRALDFRETAPLAAHEELYLDLAREGRPDASRVGPLSAGIPGSVAGLHALWEAEGSLPWAELLRPAFRLAVEGFPLGRRSAEALAEKRDRVGRHPSSRAVFFRDGRPLREGERLVQPALAETLRRLMQEGPGTFYHGSVGRRLVSGVRAAGGLWEEEDLAHYQAVWREPGRVLLEPRRGIEVLTMPPPSSASVVLAQTLGFLQRQRADLFEPTSRERARAWVESLRLAFADRNAHLADPAEMEMDWRELTEPDYLRRRSRLLPRVGEIGDSDWVGAGAPRPEDRPRASHETTHLVVIDARGRCVSLTTTLNALYGSGFVEPATGILLNDQMDDFDTRPGEPNMYGLVGTGSNVVRGGRRMLSSMSPTIVLRDGRTWLGLGGRGGPRILSGVAQVLWSRVVDGWPLDRAVAAPRVHHQWRPDSVRLEERGHWPGLRRALEAWGYSCEVLTTNGKVHAAEWTADGRFEAVADPRDEGMALCVDPPVPGAGPLPGDRP